MDGHAGDKVSNVELLNNAVEKLGEEVKKFQVFLGKIEGNEVPPTIPIEEKPAEPTPSLKQLLLETPKTLNAATDEFKKVRVKLMEDLL